jgi:hypothetical protein
MAVMAAVYRYKDQNMEKPGAVMMSDGPALKKETPHGEHVV